MEQEAILCSELTSLRKYIDTPVAIAPKSKISLCTRIGEDKTVYMLLNESLEDSDVEICINNNGALYEASLRDGSLTLVSQEGPFKFSTQFDGCGMKVFITEQGTISHNIFLH